MKFHCDRCKTRYSIGEEKIRGKVLKIRCKNCSAVITVREGQTSTGPDGKDDAKPEAKAEAKAGAGKTGQTQTQARSGGKDKDQGGKTGKDQGSKVGQAGLTNGKKGASPVLEDAFNRAMSRLPTPDPAKDLRDEDDETPSPSMPSLDTSDASGDDSSPPVEIEWYVSIDGEQEGPFTLALAQKRVGKKQPQEEMFAWQEGFDDWLPVEKVPELAAHVPAPKPERGKRGGAPPMPSDVGTAKGGGRAGAGAGLAVASSAATGAAAAKAGKKGAKDEPVSLSALAKQQAKQEQEEQDAAESATGGDFEFDIGEASRVVKLPMLVPPPRAGQAGDAAPVSRPGLPGMAGVVKGARGTGGMPIVAGGIVGDDVNLSAAVLQPQKRNKHGLVFWVGGGAMLAIVGVLFVLLLRGGDSSAGGFEEDSPTSAFIEGFYDRDPNAVPPPGLALPRDPAAPGTDGKGKTGPRKTPTKSPPIAAVNPGRSSQVEDLTDPGGGSVNDRDAEEILDAQKRFGAGLKWCFERSLKTNPDLKGRNNRYDVQITITAAGAVRSVTVAGNDRELKDCVKGKVTLWSFKPARGDFTTQFPIVFN